MGQYEHAPVLPAPGGLGDQASFVAVADDGEGRQVVDVVRFALSGVGQGAEIGNVARANGAESVIQVFRETDNHAVFVDFDGSPGDSVDVEEEHRAAGFWH